MGQYWNGSDHSNTNNNSTLLHHERKMHRKARILHHGVKKQDIFMFTCHTVMKMKPEIVNQIFSYSLKIFIII